MLTAPWAAVDSGPAGFANGVSGGTLDDRLIAELPAGLTGQEFGQGSGVNPVFMGEGQLTPFLARQRFPASSIHSKKRQGFGAVSFHSFWQDFFP